MIECLPRSGQFDKIVLQIKSMEMQKSAICINSFISKNWGAIVVNFKNPAPRASLSPIAYYCLNYLAGCIFQPELQLTFKLFSIGPPLQTCGIFHILIFNIQYFGILLSFDKCSSFDISLSLLAAFSTSADHQDNNWVREIELDNSIDFFVAILTKLAWLSIPDIAVQKPDLYQWINIYNKYQGGRS